MGATIYKQPDGLFCRYETVIEDFAKHPRMGHLRHFYWDYKAESRWDVT